MKALLRIILPLAIFYCVAFPYTAGRAEPELAAAPNVVIATKERALLHVIVSRDAGQRVQSAAKTLAMYLGQMSGAIFTLEIGDGKSGIAVGRAGNFPEVAIEPAWDTKDITRREDYLLRSHDKGLHVIGPTDTAVEYAVWDLLYRLGHRQFFPGETWEIVPKNDELALAVHARVHADFVARDIGFGFGPWGGRRQKYEEWCVRNRLARSGERPLLESGHSYDAILAEMKDEFEKHPEYHALTGVKRQVIPGEVKFCISNPGLRKVVAKYATEYFVRHKDATCVSLDPSDGLNWCECEDCRSLGSISDRVALLVNEAAAAIRERHGRDKLISIYAYAAHASPPSIKVDSQVVVNVATCMTLGNETTDEIIDGWRKQGATIGIREYYGCYPWDRDLPGQARMADLKLIQNTIPHFHERGARFMVAESSDAWGVTGLGYYLTARLLWDVKETHQIDALKADFFDKAFGPARQTMTEFYRLIDASSRPRLSSDLIGRIYRLLDQARGKTDDPAILARIDDLVLYARYVELYFDYVSAPVGPERQAGFEALVRYSYRIRDSGMVHSLAVWRGLPYYDRSVKLPEGTDYGVPEGKDPWKESKPVTAAEVQALLSAGIARHHLIEFTPVRYGPALVPINALALPKVPPGNAGLYFRDRPSFYTWAVEKTEDLEFKAKAGLIYQNVGDARLSLRRPSEVESPGFAAVPPDQKERQVTLRMRGVGLQRLELSDRTGGTILAWPAGTPLTIPAGEEEVTELYGRYTLYFYVPKGTKQVAGFADGPGELHNSDGAKVFTFGSRPNYFSVPVPAGQDGHLWKFSDCQGKRILLTVPPYLARDASELLLPEEVVKADRSR